MKKKYKKMIAFNFILAITEVVLYSDMFIGLTMNTDNSFIKTGFITGIVMSIILFIYVNYNLISAGDIKSSYKINELNTYEDYIDALNTYTYKSDLQGDILAVIEQIERFKKKEDKLKILLQQNFGEDSNLDSVNLAIEQADEMIKRNVKAMLNRFSIFDQDEYAKLRTRQSQNNPVAQERFRLYNEHITYLRELIGNNERVLLEIDRLMTEISRINDSASPNNLAEIKDLISSMEMLRVDGSNSENQELDNLAAKYK